MLVHAGELNVVRQVQMDRTKRKAADPAATATVAFLLAIPCFAVVWGWLWFSFEVQVSFWWVIAAAASLSVVAFIYPGKWLENI